MLARSFPRLANVLQPAEKPGILAQLFKQTLGRWSSKNDAPKLDIYSHVNLQKRRELGNMGYYYPTKDKVLDAVYLLARVLFVVFCMIILKFTWKSYHLTHTDKVAKQAYTAAVLEQLKRDCVMCRVPKKVADELLIPGN
eukprot:RCo006125